MFIIILPLCLISLFFSLRSPNNAVKSITETLIIAVIIFSFLLVGITELLSLFHCINFSTLILSWLAVLIVNAGFIYKNTRFFIKKSDSSYILNKLARFKFLSLFEKTLLIFTGIPLLMILAQGIVYPPNNWDSMTYHMARIVSWVSHHSVNAYPTHIVRQIYQPPFAEYVIMHFGILARSDMFANAVQFLFMIFSAITVVLIGKSLGLNRRYCIIALFLSVTIPEVILQSSSTQNDIVISFFCLSAFYFIIKAARSSHVSNYLILGLITGLAFLTKGTAYLYFAPLLLIWGLNALRSVYYTKNYRFLWHFAISIAVCICIDASFYYRNYQLTHSILGITKAESVQYANQKMSIPLLASSVVKNAGLHMGLKHVHALARVSNNAIYKLHEVAGIDINSPEVNFYHSKFTTNDTPSDEDVAPNFLNLLLIIIAFVLTIIHWIKKSINPVSKVLCTVIILQVLLFCGYLKWQPYSTRLHTPFFLLAVPLITYMMYKSSVLKTLSKVFVPLVLVYALIIITSNRLRPYDHHLSMPRYAKFFAARNEIESDYTQIRKTIENDRYMNIGLITNKDAWVYPLFYDCFNKEINPEYIEVENFSNKSKPGGLLNKNLDCIITTEINKEFIDYKNKRFRNVTTNHKNLFLYVH